MHFTKLIIHVCFSINHEGSINLSNLLNQTVSDTAEHYSVCIGTLFPTLSEKKFLHMVTTFMITTK